MIYERSFIQFCMIFYVILQHFLHVMMEYSYQFHDDGRKA